MTTELRKLDARILAIAIPSTLGYITSPLIGIVDTAILGRFDDIAMLAGLALGAITIDVIMTTANFLRSGTTGLVAQALGRGNEPAIKAIFWQAMCLAMSLGLLVLLLKALIIKTGVAALGPLDDTANAMAIYLDWRLLSAPAALINYVVLGMLFGLGRAGWALFTQLVVNLLNIALSLYWGLWQNEGLIGVVKGTLVAEWIGALFGLLIVAHIAKIHQNLSIKSILEWASFRALLSINADIMVRSFALLAAFALFARFGTSLGPEILAANALLMHFFLLSGYFLDGLATAAEQMAGFAKGKGDRALFVISINRALFWAMIVACFISLFYWLAYPLLIATLTTNDELIATTELFVLWAVITPLTGVFAFHFDGVFIGATWTKDMRKMMLLSLGIFIALAYILSQIAGNHGLWLALNLFLLARGALLWLCLPRNMRASFAP